jgi:isopentenyldiphosphate isomerase
LEIAGFLAKVLYDGMYMKTYPPVVIVDENDEVIGEAALDDARARNLIYRLSFVIVEDNQGRILLQRRAKSVLLFPDCWDISAGGHVDDGRSYEGAALAELVEEIGLTGLDLTPVAHFYTETPALNGAYPRRFITLFKTYYNTLPENLGIDEVSGVKWFTVDEIKTLVKSQPELVAEGLLHTYNHVLSQQ